MFRRPLNKVELIADMALRVNPALLLRQAGIEPYSWQERAACDDAKRVLALTSRQAGKSTISAAIALHTAIFHPQATILIVAPTLRQSQELAQKTRALAKAINLDLVGESALRIELANSSRVLALPGAEGTIRGYSANLIIIDEAAWVADELYVAIRPMLAVTQGRLIAISTPFGTRGWFWRAWTAEEEDWKRYKVTAYDIPSISREFLDAEKKALGDAMFAQEYLAEFISSGGALPEEHVRQAACLAGPESPQAGHTYVAGLDLARLRDWTSISIIDASSPPYRLVHQERWQADWKYTEERVLALVRAYSARLIVDASGVGDPIFERLRGKWALSHPFRFTVQSKTELINELRLSLAEQRILLYPEPVLLSELLALEAKPSAYGISYSAPAGAHDDTVMSLALALWAVRGRAQEYSSARIRARWA